MGILTFIIGASVGSFLNVLIDRLSKNEPITGRSHCDFCKKKLSGKDLVPILSFIFLGGKCRYCHKKLSWHYPVIETLTGLAYLLIFNFQFLNLIILWGIASCLIVIFFSDLKYHLISDYILVALFVFSLLYKVWTPTSVGVTTAVIPAQAGIQSIISGLIVALPIFLIYYISRERAMGLGDVYLSTIIGFLLGWKEGLMALYIAFVTGAIIGTGLIIFKKKKIKSRIPFGPFIVIGTIVMLFYGEKIFGMIQKIYGF